MPLSLCHAPFQIYGLYANIILENQTQHPKNYFKLNLNELQVIIFHLFSLTFSQKFCSTSMGTDHCVECSRVVTTSQQALSCDSCDRWVHRLCNTGMYFLSLNLKKNI